MNHSINFDSLGEFGAGFTKDLNAYLNSLKNPADTRRVEGFLQQMFKVFQIKKQIEK
jgi:hypothetical protein